MSGFFVKQADEGTNSPFVARMFLGILELRDLIIMTNNDPRNLQVTRENFDHLYEPVRSFLEIALDAARSLNKISIGLVETGHNGELAKLYPGGGFELINTKGTQIQKEFASVIEHSAIAIKNHLPKLMEQIFGIKIGFLFQNDPDFEKAISGLNSDGLIPLAHYLQSVRFWSNQLIKDIWNQSKHSNWKLNPPKLTIITLPIVHVDLPQVFDIPVNHYAFQVINRCCLLVEDLIVYGFQFHRSSPIGVMEIAHGERLQYQNRRFKAYRKLHGMIPSDPKFNDDLEIS